MMSPGSESERFTGKKVFLLFPWGGSSLDQFASMIVDNPQLGIHTMGLSMGGFSNTWEWEEELKVPQYGKVEFEWSAGHTIRPNGEILEGNPALAKEWVPMTAKNCGTYFTDLIIKAFEHIDRQ